MTNIAISVKKGGDEALAKSFSHKTGFPILDGSDTASSQADRNKDSLNVLFDKSGVSLTGYGLSYQGDFDEMLRRVTEGRLLHEMLAKATKTDIQNPVAIDATAGMGEDAFIIAACGYDVTLHEQNPVVALLLKDAIRRGKKQPIIKDIVSRMHVMEGDSVEILSNRLDPVDLIYLDPMFPGRKKSGLIGKKLQLIQKMESPCSVEDALFDAAISAGPSKIVVKRPLKAPFLAGRKPNYSLDGKAIRYDCYTY
ncbi:MAG: class I SAM-dependent methyltransferase [Lachnospiraceae bacterium]|nr:class I SAM-dependent methyltransferase [Lachnospiraceae bacterium]